MGVCRSKRSANRLLFRRFLVFFLSASITIEYVLMGFVIGQVGREYVGHLMYDEVLNARRKTKIRTVEGRNNHNLCLDARPESLGSDRQCEALLLVASLNLFADPRPG